MVSVESPMYTQYNMHIPNIIYYYYIIIFVQFTSPTILFTACGSIDYTLTARRHFVIVNNIILYSAYTGLQTEKNSLLHFTPTTRTKLHIAISV